MPHAPRRPLPQFPTRDLGSAAEAAMDGYSGCDDLRGAAEILPGRLYFHCLQQPMTLTTAPPNSICVHLDADLIYEPFCADFGPCNLAHSWRFCQRVNELLQRVRGGRDGWPAAVQLWWPATGRSNCCTGQQCCQPGDCVLAVHSCQRPASPCLRCPHTPAPATCTAGQRPARVPASGVPPPQALQRRCAHGHLLRAAPGVDAGKPPALGAGEGCSPTVSAAQETSAHAPGDQAPLLAPWLSTASAASAPKPTSCTSC